jgi:MerR family transcriptional regulator, light-induced transcriptional regulator
MKRSSESTKERSRFADAVSESSEHTRPELLPWSEAEVGRAQLSGLVTQKIAPRLHVFHHGVRPRAPAIVPSADDIAEFGNIVMRTEFSPAVDYFEKMTEIGYSLDALFLHLLQPTARYLADLLDNDERDSFDVAIGMSHLRALLSIFGAQDDSPRRDRDHRALLVACPTEKRLFDLDVISMFMRGAGWDVDYHPGLSVSECCKAAATQWFGVLDFTLSSAINASTAAHMIEAIRRKSVNRSISVLVGGLAFERDPELVLRLGADATASDASATVVLAERLLLSTTIQRNYCAAAPLACSLVA